MRSPLILLLVFFLLAGNLAWATDVDLPLPAPAAGLATPDHPAPAESHGGGSCNHWCHGSAHLTALPVITTPTPPRRQGRERPPRGTLPTTFGDAPPTPPPIA